MEKILLSPFTAIYALAIWIRNLAFKKKWFKTVRFDVPVICVGNLSVGGTGKTPHTEYLVRLLKDMYNIAVLSRGYRRRTSGYVEVATTSKADEVGDEPLLYKWKYPEVKVAVSEDRVLGVPFIVGDTPRVVLLDDAFQHRAVKAGLSILLTTYDKPYYDDSLLPGGRLREFKSGADRADLIVVTKSPIGMMPAEKQEIIDKINPKPYQHVFFSHLEYGNIYPLFQQQGGFNRGSTTALMLTGIADPTAMKDYLAASFEAVYERNFDDHHHFSKSDIESIITTYKNLPGTGNIIITTEKDATRLMPYRKEFINNAIPIYCLPVSVKFVETDEAKFNKAIFLYLEKTIGKPIQENTDEHIAEN